MRNIGENELHIPRSETVLEAPRRQLQNIGTDVATTANRGSLAMTENNQRMHTEEQQLKFANNAT